MEYKKVVLPAYAPFPALEWIKVDGIMWLSCANLKNTVFTLAGTASREYAAITTVSPPSGVRKALLVTKNMKNARSKRVISITEFPRLLRALNRGNYARWAPSVNEEIIDAYIRHVTDFIRKPAKRVVVKLPKRPEPVKEQEKVAAAAPSLDAFTDRVKELVNEEAKETAINRFRASEEFAKLKQHMIAEFQAKLTRECEEHQAQARAETKEAIKHAVELHMENRRAALETELRATVIKSLSRRKDIQEAARFIALEDQRQKYSSAFAASASATPQLPQPTLVPPPKVTAKSLLEKN